MSFEAELRAVVIPSKREEDIMDIHFLHTGLIYSVPKFFWRRMLKIISRDAPWVEGLRDTTVVALTHDKPRPVLE